MSEWDPIGVNDIPEATDEYDGYVGPVLDLLNASASSDEIAAYLRNVETERMNLTDAQGKPLLPAQNRNRAVHSLKLLIPHGRIPGKLVAATTLFRRRQHCPGSRVLDLCHWFRCWAKRLYAKCVCHLCTLARGSHRVRRCINPSRVLGIEMVWSYHTVMWFFPGIADKTKPARFKCLD
jgi:hypothetical protein